jgi:hypothetical protein
VDFPQHGRLTVQQYARFAQQVGLVTRSLTAKATDASSSFAVLIVAAFPQQGLLTVQQ